MVIKSMGSQGQMGMNRLLESNMYICGSLGKLPNDLDLLVYKKGIIGYIIYRIVVVIYTTIL